MKKLHSYAADPRERLKIWGHIALASYILVLIFSFLATWLSEVPVVGVISSIPITFTLIFGLLFLFYNKKLWKKFGTEIPDLNGTWVGCALPNYKKWPHLAIVTIQQTWTEIYVHEEAFYTLDPKEAWDIDKQLGWNESYAATIKDSAAKRSHLHVLYEHEGIKPSQPKKFRGAWSLRIEHAEHMTSKGSYFTDRFVAKASNQGSQGLVELVRVSEEILSVADVFQKHLEVTEPIKARLAKWQAEQDNADKPLISDKKMKPTQNIALQTKNADQALDFYQRVLGLELKPGSKDTVALGSMNLIIDQADDFHSPVFEFTVDDLEATKERLLQEGCEIVRWEGQGGCCFMRDPHGLCFNLWQD